MLKIRQIQQIDVQNHKLFSNLQDKIKLQRLFIEYIHLIKCFSLQFFVTAVISFKISILGSRISFIYEKQGTTKMLQQLNIYVANQPKKSGQVQLQKKMTRFLCKNISFANQLIHKFNHEQAHRIFKKYMQQNIFHDFVQFYCLYFGFQAVLGNIVQYYFLIGAKSYINIGQLFHNKRRVIAVKQCVIIGKSKGLLT